MAGPPESFFMITERSVPQSVLSQVVCPTCRNYLNPVDDSLICGGCQTPYPVVEGIPYLLSGQDGERTSILYDNIAHHYDDAFPGHVTDHYRTKRLKFVIDRQPSGDLLDVGCGTGHLGAAFGEAGYKVFGCDASIGMLKIFRDRSGAIVVGSRSDELPFPSNRFDVVICVALLHHVVDPDRVERTISEMIRVTRPGGLTVVWDHNPLNPYWPILMKRVPQDDGSERLIPLRELLNPIPAGADREVHRLGFIPDFLPKFALPIATRLEAVLEKTPLLNLLGAHNVVAIRKTVPSR